MEFLADENVKLRLVKWLRASGQDVTVGPKGSPDRAVAELVKREDIEVSDIEAFRVFPPS